MTFADKAINYYLNLNLPVKLPGNIQIMNPYKNPEVQEIIRKFFYKFFNDNNKRIFLLGINPGRFGGGITGVAFTDPIVLEQELGIKNNLQKKPELSCQFIYKIIYEAGGPEKFYSKYFLSALFPFALIKDGNNYNYYDNNVLYGSLKSFMVDSLKEQIEFWAREDLVISLGKKNMTYLNEINSELKYFKKIIFIEHPRYIMQYKRKSVEKYVKKYSEILKE